ncbi:hypothetical protein C2R22_12045 [Salinigranum rubrum]|uniref:DNA replication complex GINS family protein n=1 Tax=Salinigranum rubrum TaxID=755307 RepID=A0A2I8VK59_9EURY|nr:hypothetical protein [Salinigranum rubrum]AUV82284.1 hypothetical protein C2R22_12045 [Salinigranum rubrum]
MNLEELRSVQRSERQKDSLQHLRDSFYEDVAAYVVQLKDERERAVEAADDPFASEDVRQLTDKIESTREIANALYERRVGKVVKHASFAAADMGADEEGMTTEERELFDDLVARIRENRETVMATLDGKRDEAASETPDEQTTDTDPDASVAEGDPTPSASSTSASSTAPDPADDILADALGDSGETDAPSAPPDTPPGPAADSATGSAAADSATGVGSDDDSGTDRPTEEATSVSGAPDAPEASGDEGADASAVAPASGPPAGDETPTDSRDLGPERTTLRITADVGTVYGVDEREYDLAREDVVMLPTTNAEPLLRKDAAERID